MSIFSPRFGTFGPHLCLEEIGDCGMIDGPGLAKVLLRHRGYIAVKQEVILFDDSPVIGVAWVVIRPDGSAFRHGFAYPFTGSYPGDEFPTWEQMSGDIKACIDRKVEMAA